MGNVARDPGARRKVKDDIFIEGMGRPFIPHLGTQEGCQDGILYCLSLIDLGHHDVNGLQASRQTLVWLKRRLTGLEPAVNGLLHNSV